MRRMFLPTFWLLVILHFSLSACVTTPLRQPSVYTVKVREGDTLAGIAARYNTTWGQILQDNHLRDIRDVYVGQELRVRPGPGGYEIGRPGKTANADDINAPADDRNDSENVPNNSKSNSNRRRGFLFNQRRDPSLNNRQALLWPVSGPVTSYFGRRGGRFHSGIDIKAVRGTPIQAPAAGKVVFSGRRRGYGLTVVIAHPGFQTLYGHCSRLLVHRGQVVRVGEVIAMVGATGNAKGTHLHFEWRSDDNTPEDPLAKLPNNYLISMHAAH